MTGIENITAIIRQDAEESARHIISDAEAQVKKMLDEAKKQGGEKASAVEKNGSNKAKDLVDRAKSAAELEKKKNLLKAKQEIIGEVIGEAKKRLEQLGDDEYFAVIMRLVNKYSTTQDGKMLMNKKDLARLPAQFEASLKNNANGNLTLVHEPAAIKNGFLLIYGGIDINCTFDALFEESTEALQDTVSNILF